MVARRFVLRQAPGGEGEGEVHAVEYDTDHGLDVLRLQIFSLTSVPPDLQKILVEADGSVVDDGTDLESISEGLRLVSIDGEEGDDAAAAEAARAQEKSDEELARMIQIEVEADGSVVNNGTNLESISEGFRFVEIEEEDADEAVAAARAQEKSDEELARMLQIPAFRKISRTRQPKHLYSSTKKNQETLSTMKRSILKTLRTRSRPPLDSLWAYRMATTSYFFPLQVIFWC